MEAYEGVSLISKAENEEPEAADSLDLGDEQEGSEAPLDVASDEANGDTLEDFEDEKTKLVTSHLHTIRSHAHEITTCVENGALIEPWMEEKLAIANEYIVHVANAIMYKK